MAEQSHREYWIGLPVGVRVHLDGRVTYVIDTSEAGSGIMEEWGETGEDNPYTEEQALLDSAVADAQPAYPEVTTTASGEMKCPVRYSCKFRTANLGDMAAHILDKDQTHGE